MKPRSACFRDISLRSHSEAFVGESGALPPPCFRLAATGRLWVTVDDRVDGAPVEMERQVCEEISQRGTRRAARDRHPGAILQCGDFPVTLGDLRLPEQGA